MGNVYQECMKEVDRMERAGTLTADANDLAKRVHDRVDLSQMSRKELVIECAKSMWTARRARKGARV
jgi:hypothetical protein